MGWTEYEKKLKEWYGYSETKNQDDIIIDIYNSQRPAGSYKMTHTDLGAMQQCQQQLMLLGMPVKCRIPVTARPVSIFSNSGANG